jgi:hypothetical protein
VGSIIFADLFHLYLIKRRIKPFFHYKYKYLGSMSGSFPLKTVCRGSFHFLLQNERIGLVRSKTSWKWAEYELCLWSAFISWRKPSFSEMSIFSLFSSWKRAFYKFGHRSDTFSLILRMQKFFFIFFSHNLSTSTSSSV